MIHDRELINAAADLGDEHVRLAANYERWIGICLRAGEIEVAETCRADAELHRRLANTRKDAA